jgi:hypothetical protein
MVPTGSIQSLKPYSEWCMVRCNDFCFVVKATGEVASHSKDGDDLFPDCNHVAFAQTYVSSLLLEKPCMYRDLAQAAGSGHWKKCLEYQSNLIYCADGDETRTSSTAAMRRISQSIHINASGAQLLADLLDGLLQQPNDSTNVRSLPMVRDIISTGPKQAVKLAITTMVASWMRHGHYLVDGSPTDVMAGSSSSTFVAPSSSQPDDLRLCLVVETRKVLKALGRVTSSLIWLWDMEEEDGHIDMEAAYLFRDVVDQHIRHYCDTHGIIKKATKKNKDENNSHWQRLKFQMIVTIDSKKNRLPELRRSLAKVLGVEQQCSTVYDDYHL